MSLKPGQDFTRTLHYRLRDACQARHFDAVTAIRRTRYQPAQKDYFSVPVANGDIHGMDAGNFAFQGGKFMIMGGKQRAYASSGPPGQFLSNSPGQGETVEGACSPANLVKDDQTFFACLTQNAGCFHHFNHECALPLRQVVRGSHA